jgi:diacylglycerol kinase family enzyme
VIVGPSREGADRATALRGALDARGLPHDLLEADGPERASELARGAAVDGTRFVVAVGDDAWAHAVLNGLFDGGRPIADLPVLGVVGAGEGCDLLRTFGLPDDLEGGVHHLTGEATYPFDVMEISCTGNDGERTTRYAHDVARIGLGGEVAIRTGRLARRAGRAASFLGFWLALARTRASAVRIDADTKHVEAEAFDVVIGNGQYANGGLRLSPHSFPGDGVLDVLVFRGPRSDAVTMLPRIFRHGDHVPDPHVLELRARIRVAIESERPMPIAADGVVLGTTPATVRVLHQPILLKL